MEDGEDEEQAEEEIDEQMLNEDERQSVERAAAEVKAIEDTQRKQKEELEAKRAQLSAKKEQIR